MTDANGVLTRAAPLRASTWDADTLTVQAVLSTGAAVTRYDGRGAFQEVLDLNQQWPASIPLLDSHSRGSIDDRLGEVVDIRTVGNELVGTVKLSRHNERAKRVAAELSDGATFGVSIGYSVQKWTEGKQGGKRTMTAASLTLLEASLTTVPADMGAGLRSITLTTENTTSQTNTQTRAELAAEVRSIASTAGLDQAWVDSQTDAETIDINAVRAAALTAMQARSAAAASVRSTHNEQTLDNPDVRIRAAGEAFYSRVNPAHQPSDQAREFVGLSTIDMARDSLRRSGISTAGMSPAAIIDRGLMSTSDFPAIFADTANRSVRAAYDAAPSGIRQLARASTARDFRTKTSISVANSITLEKVNEHGEYKAGGLVEAKEAYGIDDFGKIIGITRKMLVNDDIGAFSDVASRMGQAAAGFEADFLYKMISSNPVMDDGKAVFHSDHKNLAGSGAAISVASLSAARKALRGQTDAGANLISITPKFLLCGPDKETEGEQVLASIAAAQVAETNPFSGKLTLVVEPRMTGNQWYVVADPAQVPSLEYSYLDGEPGPQVSQEVGFTVDGIRFKVRLSYGAGWLDHRGWYKQPGA